MGSKSTRNFKISWNLIGFIKKIEDQFLTEKSMGVSRIFRLWKRWHNNWGEIFKKSHPFERFPEEKCQRQRRMVTMATMHSVNG